MTFILLLVQLFLALNVVDMEWIKEMEDVNLYQGDIVLDPDEKKSMENNAYASIKGGRWPNAIIPYKVSSTISSNVLANIPKAIEEFEKHTCLRFKKRTSESAYLNFYRGDGCSSPVGYRKSRMNGVSLAYGCSSVGTIIHEIGHSIGLDHEQNRPDRNSYPSINWDNIPKDMEYNFYKQFHSKIDSLGTNYDYLSIMHYSRTAFGKGKVTIDTKNSLYRYKIGKGKGFSTTDIKQINLMYCGGAIPTLSVSTSAINPKPTVITTSSSCINEWSIQDCAFWITQKNCKENDLVQRKCCQSCSSKWSLK